MRIDQPRTITRQTTLMRSLTRTMSSTGIRTATPMAGTGLVTTTMAASPVMRCRTSISRRARTWTVVRKEKRNQRCEGGVDRRPLVVDTLLGNQR